MSNYPEGAKYDKSAPYNQNISEEKEFDCTISITLSKNTTVYTDDYEVECIEDYDEETGRPCGYDVYHTSDKAVEDAYQQQHYTPLELIEEFKHVLETLVLPALKESKDSKSKKYFDFLVSECEGWNIDDEVIVKD